jgi:capsular polysaccharide biosynthesis protein
MELKQYLEIIKKDIKLFLIVIVVIIAAAFLFFYFRPVSYSASLTINITRNGIQNTPDYRYDDFYRLQADEKFAETVVQWLKSPRIISDIYKEAGIGTEKLSLRQLSGALKPEKLSSQIVAVTYSSSDPKKAGELAQSIAKVISTNTQNLNKNQKEDSWFEISASQPVIVKDIFKPIYIFLISLVVGIFVGFWIVLLKHYLN